MPKDLSAEAKKQSSKKDKPKETTAELISSLASVLVIGLFIITFCLQAFEIPSSSMVKTLLVGDHVFVDRVRLAPPSRALRWLTRYREPQRGDIVVFVSPAQPDLYVVKRVIGMPGDRIHLVNGSVFVNGVKQDEPYAIHSVGDYNAYRDNFPAVPADDQNLSPEWQLTLRDHIKGADLVVPPDTYFGMGDNRDVSYDSRYWGFIPRRNIVGRPMFTYWSFETPENQWQQTDLGSRVQFMIHVVTHFFSDTRFSRMFHVVH